MAKKRKADAAEKIASTEYPYPTSDSLGEEDEYNHNMRELLAAKIRKGIEDAEAKATEAERERVQAILNTQGSKCKRSKAAIKALRLVYISVTQPLTVKPTKGATK
jgi:hypothetical protein